MDEPVLTYNRAVRELRRSEGDVVNRLRSIVRDAEWVEEVLSLMHNEDAKRYPVLANLRCGAWYLRPGLADGAVHFKSTDGHYGTWDFSLSRLNVNLLRSLEEHGAAVVVDATRKGKVYPDSFARTIPLWAAVINRVKGLADGPLRPDEFPLVSNNPSELSQIDAKVAPFVSKALACGVQWGEVHVSKRVAITYVSQHPGHTALRAIGSLSESHHTLILVSACAPTPPQRLSYTYVQGAGDDHQSWSRGLTPPLFWKRVLLDEEQPSPAGGPRTIDLNQPPIDCIAAIDQAVSQEQAEATGGVRHHVERTANPGERRSDDSSTPPESAVEIEGLGDAARLYVCASDRLGSSVPDILFVSCLPGALPDGAAVVFDGELTGERPEGEGGLVCVVRESSKKDFLKAIPHVVGRAVGRLASPADRAAPLLLACDTGAGVSVAAAVAVIAALSPTGWAIPPHAAALPP
eukprot:gene20377-31355_t